MAPGPSSEDLRLPPPSYEPGSEGGDGSDAEALQELVELASDPGKSLERTFQKLQCPRDQVIRMQALLTREAGMLSVVARLFEGAWRIREHMREERQSQDS